MPPRTMLAFLTTSVLLPVLLALPAFTGTGAGDGVGGGAILSSVTPAEGSTGTLLTLSGSGFGSGKPKVFLRSLTDGKRRKLVVESFADDLVTCRVRKAVVGAHDVVLRPKGKGGKLSEGVALETFEVRLPEPMTISTVCAAPGDELTVDGLYFGSRKGSLRVGGKKAKVLSWETGVSGAEGAALDRVRLRLPKKKIDGIQTLSVRNRIGEAALPEPLFVFDEALGLPAGDTLLTGAFDGVLFEAEPTSIVTLVDGETGQTQLFAADSSGASVEFRVLYDPVVDETVVLDGLEILSFTYQRDGVLWVVGFDEQLASSLTLSLDARCQGVLTGGFSGSLRPRLGEGSLAVAAGSFQVAWTP